MSSAPTPKIRLYVDQPLSAGAPVAATADQAHYLNAVMRLKANDQVRLFNGRDGEWRAEIGAASRNSVLLHPLERIYDQSGVPDVWLLFAPLKRARLDFMVQKATELGASRLRPVWTSRTAVGRVNLERMRANAIEAAEQTGRMEVPLVDPEIRLDALLRDWDPARRIMFCDEAGDDPAAEWGGPHGRAEPAATVLAAFPSGRPWAILIGPEGGFDPDERNRLRSHPASVPVRLGPRVLRADTAAASALTLWQSVLGDWTEPAAGPGLPA